MKVLMSGMEIMNTAVPAYKEIATQPIKGIGDPVLVHGVPNFDIPGMGDALIHLGQQVLIGTGAVVIVVAGILMIVGLKKEGWKRIGAIFQGLGVGLIGPTVVMLVAGLFVGFAKMLG